MKTKIHRRTFLRSSATGISTLVGLPLLEAMYGGTSAYADAHTAVPRFFAMYVPNGIIEEKWFPERGGKRDFNLAQSSLKAFDTYGLKDDISLYRGMNNASHVENSSGNDHMVAISSWLTGKGIRSDESQTHRPSIDQELADMTESVYGRTKVHSLQLAGNSELDKPNNNRYFNPLKNALNWGANNRLLPLKSALRNEFDKLYAGASSAPGEGIDRRIHMKLSVLDDVQADREALLKKLGASDRERMDQYFTSLRDLEESLTALVENSNTPNSCPQPDVTYNNIPNPANGSKNNGFGDHARVAAKITAQAFACDLTRAITYCTQGEAAGCEYRDIGINTHFHNSISHNRSGRYNDWVKIDTFHADLCAYFLHELKTTPHGTGNLLDGTACLFGSGLGNGDQHQHTKIALMVGGHFGNWQHGNYHNFNGRNHADLIDTLRLELGLPTLGYSPVPIS